MVCKVLNNENTKLYQQLSMLINEITQSLAVDFKYKGKVYVYRIWKSSFCIKINNSRFAEPDVAPIGDLVRP